jgi:prolyl-tRNA synthetase
LCEELLALPVIFGKKTDKEKFAGAKYTLTIEAFMPDGKALQCGTSHNLGQGFAKAFGISFLGKDEKKHTPWQNSWGLSTRLIGGLVMTHSDNKGLVLPPNVAENKVVIIPIFSVENKDKINEKAFEIKKALARFNPIFDDRDEYSPGWKYNEYELKGIPIRIEIGPRDLEKKQAMVVRRDTGKKEAILIKDIAKSVPEIIEKMQKDMLEKAQAFLENSTVTVKTWNEFMDAIKKRKLVKTVWCNEQECEDWIKDKTGGASSRCIPLEQEKVSGNCPHCGKPAKTWIYFSKSY